VNGEVKRLTTPLSEEDARGLRTGDLVFLTGKVHTLRDQGHIRALDQGVPVDLEGAVVFHCGPLVRETAGGWDVLAAGPTTSIRMEGLTREFIERFGPRALMGKGGMGRRTSEALQEFGCVYLAWTGGAAVLAAEAIRSAEVQWLDLGTPEALWTFDVEELGPAVVAMDSHGGDLYQEVRDRVQGNMPAIRAGLGI